MHALQSVFDQDRFILPRFFIGGMLWAPNPVGRENVFSNLADPFLCPYLVQTNFASINFPDILDRRLAFIMGANPIDFAYSL